MRYVVFAAIVLGLVGCGAGAPLPPEPPAPDPGVVSAAHLNDLGQEFEAAEMYLSAEKAVTKALRLDPRGVYFYNLCRVRTRQGKFEGAYKACRAVSGSNADEAVWRKARDLGQRLRGRLEQQQRAAARARPAAATTTATGFRR